MRNLEYLPVWVAAIGLSSVLSVLFGAGLFAIGLVVLLVTGEVSTVFLGCGALAAIFGVLSFVVAAEIDDALAAKHLAEGDER